MPIEIQWLLFIGAIAMLFTPLFVAIAFDESDPTTSVSAAGAAVFCAYLLPVLLKVLT